jgi:hypothetical protein
MQAHADTMGDDPRPLEAPMPTWQLAWLAGSAMGILGGALLALAALFPWVRGSEVTGGYVFSLLQLGWQYLIVFLLPALGVAAAVLCVFSLLRSSMNAAAASKIAAACCLAGTACVALVGAGVIVVTLDLMEDGVTYGLAPFLSILGSVLAFVGCLLVFLDSRQGGGVVKPAPKGRQSRKARSIAHCPHCGSEAMPEWTLCPICGKPLGGPGEDGEEGS